MNLVWTNEINVIKQGSQIILALLAGWAAPVILVLPYMLVLRGKISGEAYIALLTLVLALAAAFSAAGCAQRARSGLKISDT